MLPYTELADFLLRMAVAERMVHPQMAMDLAQLAIVLDTPTFHRAAHFHDACRECGGIMVVKHPITRETKDFCDGYRAILECSNPDCGEWEMR